ncbi:MAG: nucleotidyltransferase domain-containing protein [Promethearchaeota archaeon]
MKVISQILPEIELQIKNYSKNIHSYIQEVVNTIENHLGNGSIQAIILFGSLAYGDPAKISDIDLLILIRDGFSNRDIRKLEPHLEKLEIIFNLAPTPKRIDQYLLRALNFTTGMFKSYFICQLSAWKNQKFTKIFRTAPLFSEILAPKHLVIESVKKRAKIIWAKKHVNPLKLQKLKISRFELIKSLAMCSIMAIGSTFLLIIDEKYVKYQLEAFKWAYRASHYYLFQTIVDFPSISKDLNQIGYHSKTFHRFLQLRHNPKIDLIFTLHLLLEILKIHIFSLKNKKIQLNNQNIL